MDTPAAAVALLIVAIAVVGTAAGAQLVFEDTGDHTSIEESFTTGSVGDTVVLNESNREGVFYDRDVTVTNDTGERMIQGTDFEWDDRNGTLTVESDSLASQSNATIDYGYNTPNESQRMVASWMGMLTGNLATFLPLLMIIGLLFGGLVLLGGLS